MKQRELLLKLAVAALLLSIAFQVIFFGESFQRYGEKSIPVTVDHAVGYKIDGNQYLVNAEDPQLYLNYHSSVQLVYLKLKIPQKVDSYATLYFTEKGQVLDEAHSISQPIKAGTTDVYLKVPYGNYETLRLDVGNFPGESFQIEQIAVLSSPISILQTCLNKISLISTIVLFFLFMGLLYVIKRVNQNGVQDFSCLMEPESDIPLFFLKTMIPIGALLVFISMPLSSPDEVIHFLNSYAFSRGDAFPEVVDGALGKYIPANIVEFTEYWHPRVYEDVKFTINELIQMSHTASVSTSSIFYPSPVTGISPICYLMSSLGMLVGQGIGNLFNAEIVNTSPYNLMIYGRLGNLVFYIGVIYWALKLTPRFKRTMLLLSMMPMSLFLGTSINYDAILIPISFLTIAVVLKILNSRANEIVTSDIVLVLVCVFFLVAVKQVYAVLVLLFLAIPRKKYGTTKRMALCITAVAVTAFLAYIPNLIIGNISIDVVDPNAALRQEQTQFVLTHLGHTGKIILNNIKESYQSYLLMFFGNLGWLNVPLPVPMETIFYALLILIAGFECLSSPIWDQKWKRGLAAAGVIIGVMAIMLSMYINHTILYTTVGSHHIHGIQGRYFIPLFLPAVLIAANGFLTRLTSLNQYRKYADIICKNCAFICGLWTVLIVAWRFL